MSIGYDVWQSFAGALVIHHGGAGTLQDTHGGFPRLGVAGLKYIAVQTGVPPSRSLYHLQGGAIAWFGQHRAQENKV